MRSFKKRGATEFYGNEDAIKAYEWLDHTGGVFEIVVCDNKQRVVLINSMLRGIANVRWKSMRNSFKEMLNATIWNTAKKQFCRKF